MKESLLYRPLRDYLAANGYTVQAEVHHCDIAAQKDGQLIVIEQKAGFNATLLIQAAERQKYADAVYIAIPAPAGKPRNWKGMCHLLKRLEIGLILVYHPLKNPRVEIQFHPAQWQKRRNPGKRRIILQEMETRSGDYNTGGTTGVPLVTAYREEALFVACCLEKYGECAIKKIRELGGSLRTTGILNSNFYEWFTRVDRGVYALSGKGRNELKKYTHITNTFAIPKEK